MTPAEVGQWVGLAAGCSALVEVGRRFLLAGYRFAKRAEGVLAVVEHRSAQLVPNGGASLADRLGRIEDKVDDLGERVAVVEHTSASAAHHSAAVAKASGVRPTARRRSA